MANQVYAVLCVRSLQLRVRCVVGRAGMGNIFWGNVLDRVCLERKSPTLDAQSIDSQRVMLPYWLAQSRWSMVAVLRTRTPPSARRNHVLCCHRCSRCCMAIEPMAVRTTIEWVSCRCHRRRCRWRCRCRCWRHRILAQCGAGSVLTWLAERVCWVYVTCDCDADADAVRCTRNAFGDATAGVDTLDLLAPATFHSKLLASTRPQIAPPPRNRCEATSPPPHLQSKHTHIKELPSL